MFLEFTFHSSLGGQSFFMNFSIRNFKFAQKISVLTVSFFLFLVIVGIASITQLSDIHAKVTELNNSRLVPIVKLENIKSDIEYIRAQANAIMDTSSDKTKSTIQKDIDTRAAQTEKQLAAYQNKPEYKKMIDSFNAFIAAKDSFIKSQGAGTKKAMGISSANENTVPSGPPQDIAKLDKTRKTAVNAVETIIKKEVQNADHTYRDSKIVYKSTLIIIISLLFLGAVNTIILSIIITKSIVNPVINVTSKLKEISQSNGDLTQRIGYKSKDEIGELSASFDLFADKLLSIMKDVAGSATVISSSSEHLNNATGHTTKSLEGISKTLAEIASETSQEAAVTEETTAKLAEAANFSENTSAATRHTTENTRKVKEAAEEGASKISDVVSSISGIAASSKEVSLVINDLNNSSNKIGDIIKIISGISAQTNLLALNAAIEAARAGEAGKGFSVVAEEIRKLADESNHAALEISDLVQENQVKSTSAVNSVHLVEQKVNDGVCKASEVAGTIQNIIDHIHHIVIEVEQIDHANEQQALSSKEMEQAISNLALSSNEIAAGTENITSSIEEQLRTMTEIDHTTEQLSQMAKKLRELTAGFKL